MCSTAQRPSCNWLRVSDRLVGDAMNPGLEPIELLPLLCGLADDLYHR